MEYISTVIVAGLFLWYWLHMREGVKRAGKEYARVCVERDRLLRDVSFWKGMVDTLNVELSRRTRPTYQPSNSKVDKDLLDAVKKGMMAAHPDHGGNQEDFIRFHKKYNELRGRR